MSLWGIVSLKSVRQTFLEGVLSLWMIFQDIGRQESADKFVGKIVLFSRIIKKHTCFLYPFIWFKHTCLGSNVCVLTVFKNLNIVYICNKLFLKWSNFVNYKWYGTSCILSFIISFRVITNSFREMRIFMAKELCISTINYSSLPWMLSMHCKSVKHLNV